ncbi:MAG: hypothetical protein RR365_07145 [Bacteroides sp.]
MVSNCWMASVAAPSTAAPRQTLRTVGFASLDGAAIVGASFRWNSAGKSLVSAGKLLVSAGIPVEDLTGMGGISVLAHAKAGRWRQAVRLKRGNKRINTLIKRVAVESQQFWQVPREQKYIVGIHFLLCWQFLCVNLLTLLTVFR